MVERHPAVKIGIQSYTKVPTTFTEGLSLGFENFDIAFDGSSQAATFVRGNGKKVILLFPNPSYWSAKAKRESKQPVAFQLSKGLAEIAPDSHLESRVLELLADDIATGRHDPDTTLTLIRIRDCIFKRRPLVEMVERYNPETWQPRPEQFPFGPFGPVRSVDEVAKHDEP